MEYLDFEIEIDEDRDGYSALLGQARLAGVRVPTQRKSLTIRNLAIDYRDEGTLVYSTGDSSLHDLSQAHASAASGSSDLLRTEQSVVCETESVARTAYFGSRREREKITEWLAAAAR